MQLSNFNCVYLKSEISISLLILLFTNVADSIGQSHSFKESTYSVVFDDYCYRQEGFLKISDVNENSFKVEIEVSNVDFKGSLECIARTDGYKSYAQFSEYHGDEKSTFGFWLSPDGKYLFVEYNGPGFIYSGAGVCVEGYYLLD